MKLYTLNKNGKMQIYIHYRKQQVSLLWIKKKSDRQLWWIQITWDLFYNQVKWKLVKE